MNAVIWLVTGGLVAALAIRLMQWNAGRGLVVAVLIGAFCAYFGGSVLTPLFEAPGVIAAGEFNPFALIVATCTALAGIYLSDTFYDRFGA
ncbi:MAG TPA: hypothetical protein VED01_09360 [Burkholderiales bacterium]|nr:hypothetical protein [Burkholderiales bacterium]